MSDPRTLMALLPIVAAALHRRATVDTSAWPEGLAAPARGYFEASAHGLSTDARYRLWQHAAWAAAEGVPADEQLASLAEGILREATVTLGWRLAADRPGAGVTTSIVLNAEVCDQAARMLEDAPDAGTLERAGIGAAELGVLNSG